MLCAFCRAWQEVALWLETLILRLEHEEAAHARALARGGSSSDSPHESHAPSAEDASSFPGRQQSFNLDSLEGGWSPSAQLAKRGKDSPILRMGAVLGVANEADELADELANLQDLQQNMNNHNNMANQLNQMNHGGGAGAPGMAVPGRGGAAAILAARGYLPGDTPDSTPRVSAPGAASVTDVTDGADGWSNRRPGAKFGKLGGGAAGGGGKESAMLEEAAEARAKLASWSESGGVREAAFKKARAGQSKQGKSSVF